MKKKPETTKAALDDLQESIDDLRRSLGLETSIEKLEREAIRELKQAGIDPESTTAALVISYGKNHGYYNKRIFGRK